MRQTDISQREMRDRLRLARSPRIGPATYRRLLRKFGTADQALAALPELAARGGARGRYSAAPEDLIDAELDAGLALGATLLAVETPAYPTLLTEIADPPPTLWALGDPQAAESAPAAVGVVGARGATPNGRRLAEWLAAELSSSGRAVISGLARGIDTAAHRGALSGDGQAGAAVVAGGVDIVYPLENASLRDAMIERGVILSEMPIGLQPQARHFPRRNRIISGLSAGLIVIEAAERSGSLITAAAALEQNREIMAAPGHPLDPRAAGSNRLIREGATLIRNAADVVEALENEFRLGKDGQATLLEPAAPMTDYAEDLVERLATALSYEATPIDVLVRALDAPAGAIAAALLELELAGRAETSLGGAALRSGPPQ